MFYSLCALTRRLILLAPAILLLPVFSFATDFYVSPSGGGNGTISSPWDLRTGCQSSSVRPGDTLWLRGGTYGSGGSTSINCTISGNSSTPVYIRQYPGERATIMGGLGIYSNYAWYWGFEISNSWTRSTGECGSFPSIKSADAVFFTQGAVGNKLINMVIHDAANGISDQQEASGTEDYGNILFNNGWASSCDRGHGHALYIQNTGSAVKMIQENIGFNSYDIGLQAYGSAPVSRVHFVGNVMFNNGVPGGHRVDNFYIGGGSPRQDVLFQDNVAYNPLDASPGETGYNQMTEGSNVDLTMRNNYWIGATPTGYVTLQVNGWQVMNFTGNTVVGPMQIIGVGTYNWSGNSYFNSTPPGGVDSGSPVVGHNPTGVKIMVRPNKYEPGRAHIIVLNWDKLPSVTVDLSGSGLAVGTTFQIKDAQNFYGPAVYTGTYSGSPITLPMNLSAVAQMVNYTTPPHTSAEFGAFVVLPTGGTTPINNPTPPPTVNVSVAVNPTSASLSAGQAQQFNATVTGSTNASVSWSMSPSVGTLSASGFYTAPSTISSTQTVSVRATSLADSTKYASATITLNATTVTNPTPPPTGTGGTAGSWSFDTADISGALALDRSGNGLNGLMATTSAAAGAVNQALAFNGSSSVVSVASNPKLDLGGSMTFSAWIKTTNNSRTEDFMGKYDATGTEWGYILKTLPSGVIGLRVGGNNTSSVRDVADTTPINNGQWHHIAVVINLGSNVQFYVDGALRSTQAMATRAAGNSAPLWIGTIPFNYFGMPFTGSLDNIRIDNQALTAAAIAGLASAGGSGTNPTPTPTPTPTIAVTVSPTTASLTAGQTKQFAAAVTGTTNTAVVWSMNPAVGTLTQTGFYTAPASIASQQNVTVTATSQASAGTLASAVVTLTPTTTSGSGGTTTGTTSGATGGLWSFDTADISGAQTLDRSGNGLNGTWSGTTIVTGQINQGFGFNGVNSVVTVPSSSKIDLVGSMTISTWIKTTNNSRTEDILGKYDASASEWGYILKSLPSGGIGLRVGGNNSNGVRDVADATAVNDGQWHHVAVVINLGSSAQFYIDGTLRSTQALPTLAAGNSAPLWIGTIPFSYFGLPFTGSLDNVRIDNQALSASAVASLAGSTSTGGTGTTTGGGTGTTTGGGTGTTTGGTGTTPAPTAGVTAGTWSFDTADISGALVLDRSGNGLNGVLSNANAVAGKVNQALAFNGVNSVVTVNDNAKLELMNSMTISAWVKTTNNSRTEDFLGKYDASGTEWGYILKTLPSGVVGLRLGGNNVAGTRDVADTTPINDGQWHHVAVVINLGSTVQFYIDGTLRSTQAMATLAAPNSAPLWIGTIPFNYFGAPFTGSLDGVRIDAQALSASAVAALAAF